MDHVVVYEECVEKEAEGLPRRQVFPYEAAAPVCKIVRKALSAA